MPYSYYNKTAFDTVTTAVDTAAAAVATAQAALDAIAAVVAPLQDPFVNAVAALNAYLGTLHGATPDSAVLIPLLNAVGTGSDAIKAAMVGQPAAEAAKATADAAFAEAATANSQTAQTLV